MSSRLRNLHLHPLLREGVEVGTPVQKIRTRATPVNKLTFIALSVLAAVTSVTMVGCVSTAQATGPAATHPAFDPTASTKLVAFHELRVKNDPQGAIGWAMLAESYLSVASERDDNGAAIKAEAAARKSLDCRRSHNEAAAALVSKALLAQHRFTDALKAIQDARLIGPENDTLQRQEMEILLELGRYDEFKKGLDFLTNLTDPAARTLHARWAGLTGQNLLAIRLLKQVTEELDSITALPGATVSWYYVQLAAAYERDGQLSQARQALDRAVELNDHDFKAMAAIARITLAQGDSSEAKEWALKSVAVTPTVEAAALLEDLGAKEHNLDETTKYATMVDKVSHPDMYRFLEDPSAGAPESKPHTHDRLYATYLADHARNLPDALAAATKDLTSRQDVYAYDTLAWVLHQSGRDKEAQPIMAKAMALGTKDAKLLVHAGLIDSALGEKQAAKKELAKIEGRSKR